MNGKRDHMAALKRIGRLPDDHIDLAEAALAIGAFCTASIHDGVVELRVEDAGEGMDAMTLRRAFEPFFTSAPFGDRTGLGLAVVHGVVSQNDGSVHLESHVGRGTSVRVDWPVSGDV